MSLICHIPLSKRQEMFEVVRQQLSSYVYTFYMLPDDLPVLEG